MSVIPVVCVVSVGAVVSIVAVVAVVAVAVAVAMVVGDEGDEDEDDEHHQNGRYADHHDRDHDVRALRQPVATVVPSEQRERVQQSAQAELAEQLPRGAQSGVWRGSRMDSGGGDSGGGSRGGGGDS